MYSSLIDAPVNTPLVILEVTNPGLETWLKRAGLFTGARVVRHDEELNFAPVRVKAPKGDVIIPAGLAMKIYVHLDSGEKVPLSEMKKKETGHVEFLTSGRHAERFLSRFGLEEDSKIVFMRALPHMDYITVIDGRERTRLSEGEVARIWGRHGSEDATQFYFAQNHTPFTVEDVMGGPMAVEHLKTHGVTPGTRLDLETIEQAQSLHLPVNEPVIVSSPGGLRLFINPKNAGQIIVTC